MATQVVQGACAPLRYPENSSRGWGETGLKIAGVNTAQAMPVHSGALPGTRAVTGLLHRLKINELHVAFTGYAITYGTFPAGTGVNAQFKVKLYAHDTGNNRPGAAIANTDTAAGSLTSRQVTAKSRVEAALSSSPYRFGNSIVDAWVLLIIELMYTGSGETGGGWRADAQRDDATADRDCRYTGALADITAAFPASIDANYSNSGAGGSITNDAADQAPSIIVSLIRTAP